MILSNFSIYIQMILTENLFSFTNERKKKERKTIVKMKDQGQELFRVFV